MTHRVLVDTMNVVGSRADGWWNDPDRAVRKMVRALDAYAAQSDVPMTAVLDKDPRPVPEVEHVAVVIARRKGRDAADHEIEQIVADADDPSAITVITSDKRLREKVRSMGASVTGSGEFRRRVDALSELGEL